MLFVSAAPSATVPGVYPGVILLSKICLGCENDLPLEAFGKSSEGKLGRLARCKACRAEEARLAREITPPTEEQREEARVRSRAWNAANKEQKATTNKAWAQANPARMADATIRWRKKNPEKVREARQRFLEANPQYFKDWREANPERVKAIYTAWKSANQDWAREYARQWRINNPAHGRRRAEAFKNSDFNFDQWLEILGTYDHRCVYCGREDLPLTMDHVLPISKGGPHTKDNIVPACQPCNSRKGAKDPSLFERVVKPTTNSKGGA